MMNRLLSFAILASLLTVLGMSASVHAASAKASATASASAGASDDYAWQVGPVSSMIAGQALLKIPAGYAFLADKDARRLLRRLGNPNNTHVVGLMTDESRTWLVVMRFEKTGFIKDADAKNWNQDKMLETIRKVAETTNKQRSKQNVAEIDIMGWLEKPAYDPRQHMLTWAVAVHDRHSIGNESQGINFNTVVLTRDGYFSFNLVTGLSHIDVNKAHLTRLVAGLDILDGKQYNDYVATKDPVARFGLTQLVDGSIPVKRPGFRGAVADFFSDHGMKLLVLLVLIVLGVAGFFGWRFWKKRKASKPTSILEPVEPSMEGAAPEAPAAEPEKA